LKARKEKEIMSTNKEGGGEIRRGVLAFGRGGSGTVWNEGLDCGAG